ncbi:RagB/SusD family nutrient uptake outer membrane protein [Echinicola sp. CAU 1574]|uniref:RagB/SusD family nutrient uptake outer membrane protein n=1 Tax=Echinicola arenosa TaxID=2774144 RepID=A0ABR9AN73_9BACT|nr:RagB/SusD family nutrient uptake outer membrane protein [Echinicola arenosa]MBD8489064.1 RagB/SusD family nutrient uptake outer membrane protein [Echinicola arenosa]
MNIKRYLILLVCFTALASSCTDLLDVKPEDRQSITNAFDDDSELMGFLITIQGEIQYMIQDDPHVPMGAGADRCDNVAYSNLRGLVPETVKISLYSSWKEYYDVIYLSNLILENIDQAESNMTADRIDFYKGQAYFTKGWMYLELGRIWGNAIITEGTNNFEAYGNSTDEEVIAEAIKNLQMAYELLDEYGTMKDANGNLLTSKQYGSKGAAAGLLAHAYAWQGSMAELYNWENVSAQEAYNNSIEWSTKLISGEASAPYGLSSNIEAMLSENISSWDPATRLAAQESILEVQNFYQTDNSGGYADPLAERYTTWPVDLNASTSYINQSQVTFKYKSSTIQNMYPGEDERKGAYFYKVDSMATKGYEFAYPYKIREGVFRVVSQATGRTLMTGLNCNEIYIRLAGIYLLRAECYAKIGNAAAATQDLNTIRARAKADLYPAPEDTDLQYAIFREREKELMMERTRFYDVVRNNYFRTELSEAFANLTNQDIQDGALYLNIGQDAFTNNTLLKQNIYWNRTE